MNFSKSGGRVLAALAIAAALARPAAAATITVNSITDTVADDGQCTLREAITAANDNLASGLRSGECAAGDASAPGAVVRDVINFAIGSTGPPVAFVLRPATPLPVIIETVFIDGYSQTGATPNTMRSGGNAVLMLDLRGDTMAPDCDPNGPSPVQGGAFQFIGAAASGSRLRGFAIGGFKGHPAAVVIHRAGGVQIDGNFIGFGADGQPQDNDGYGIVVMNGAFDRVLSLEGEKTSSQAFDDGGAGNLIGGRNPQERNVIGSSKVGVFLAGQRNRVEGNYIGVSVAGDASMPNRGDAVFAGELGLISCQAKTEGFRYVGDDNTIGGLSSGAGNFFSAESNNCAVRLQARGTHVEGNFMGTDRDGGSGVSGFGLAAQPGCGVFLAQGAHQSHIAYNTIAFNGKGVVAGPTVSRTRPPSAANDIHANSIFSNVSLGIDLANDGMTANDSDDADAGPNGLHNFPERLAATPSGIRGVLMGAPDTQHRIDFYRNTRCNPSGQGDGEKFLGSTSVLTDSSGKVSFSAFVAGLQVERFVTATATSVADGTSEFSQCVMVKSGIGAQVEVRSSRNPALSHDRFQLTVLVRGIGGVTPTGVVTLIDPRQTTTTGGQTVFHTLASGTLVRSTAGPDTAELLVDSRSLRRKGSEWGNLHIRAQFGGDAVYAAASSADFVQAGSREKSDLDGDGLTDVLLCNSANDKFVVTTQGGSFMGPSPLSQIDQGRTVLGTAELGFPPQPAVVWSELGGVFGATTFSLGSPQQDFAITLPSGLVVEALGSMYGDLKDDLVVRDAGGQRFGVLTSGFSGSSLQLLSPWPTGNPATSELAQVGDFNGDGNLDWLFRDPASPRHILWLLDGAFNVIETRDLDYVPTGGRVTETGDFNGDGRTDLVWSLPGGDFEIVLQDGAAMRAQTRLAFGAQNLTIVGTGFFDDGSGTTERRSSLLVRSGVNTQLEAWINTALNGELPIFGQVQPVPTGGLGLTVCGR